MTPIARIQTTRDAPWQVLDAPDAVAWGGFEAGLPDVIVRADQPRQVVEGFGACFNELGWTALSVLSDAERESVLREVFAPGVGAGLSLCRLPIGANDFSRDWYSYDETPGDFGLADFDVSNDLDTLVPFIRAASRHQPELKLWASPWSPPTWMKRNGHYAGAPTPASLGVDNGLRPDQAGREGTDMFIVEERYLDAYARYFGRFLDAYADLGIRIGMVMPQNEFNSPQVFPSCTWTPEGLHRFVAHLAPELAVRDVELFLGTLERPDDRLLDAVLDDPATAASIAGVGLQWAGRGAVAAVHRLHPELRIYQSEQECGDGRNDWRHMRHAWALMKDFFDHGANAYDYWNIALLDGGVSRWGWAQNSLVVVGLDGTYRYTNEYQLLKHVAAFVRPGARYVETMSMNGHDNQLAFANPDGSLVVVVQNDLSEPETVSILAGDRMLAPTLPADSFTTLVIPGT